MGFSLSAVVAIFTASIIYMASMFYPLADMSYHKVLEAEKNSNELWKEKLNTKILITDADRNDITVLNDGSITLNSSRINLLANGEFISSSLYTVDLPGVWSPGTSIVIGFDSDVDVRILIVTENGISANRKTT